MKNKGQALIEFVIILPVFILMLLAIIDIGKILYNQTSLENKMNDVISLYKKDYSKDEISQLIRKEDGKYTIEINLEQEFVELNLSKEIDLITPGLNLIFGTPCQISAKRVVYNE